MISVVIVTVDALTYYEFLPVFGNFYYSSKEFRLQRGRVCIN